MFLLYLVVTLFHTNTHVLLDMLFLKISWENEIKIIKRSLQSIIAIVSAIFIGVFPIAASIDKPILVYIYAGVIFLLTIVSYIVLKIYGNKHFNNISKFNISFIRPK